MYHLRTKAEFVEALELCPRAAAFVQDAERVHSIPFVRSSFDPLVCVCVNNTNAREAKGETRVNWLRGGGRQAQQRVIDLLSAGPGVALESAAKFQGLARDLHVSIQAGFVLCMVARESHSFGIALEQLEAHATPWALALRVLWPALSRSQVGFFFHAHAAYVCFGFQIRIAILLWRPLCCCSSATWDWVGLLCGNFAGLVGRSKCPLVQKVLPGNQEGRWSAAFGRGCHRGSLHIEQWDKEGSSLACLGVVR